jgi:hypothetical protein
MKGCTVAMIGDGVNDAQFKAASIATMIQGGAYGESRAFYRKYKRRQTIVTGLSLVLVVIGTFVWGYGVCCSRFRAPDSLPRHRLRAAPLRRTKSERRTVMADERPRLTASEIEEELLAELQKLPTLHDTQSVTIRPYSGPKSFTWELDRIEPEVGPTQSKFVDVATVVAQLQQQYDLDLSPPPPA